MSRLQNTARAEAAQSNTTYQRHSAASADNAIREAEARVRAQEAHVLRLIVQGAPTQFAEDVLRELTAAAEAMKRQRSLSRG